MMAAAKGLNEDINRPREFHHDVSRGAHPCEVSLWVTCLRVHNDRITSCMDTKSPDDERHIFVILRYSTTVAEQSRSIEE